MAPIDVEAFDDYLKSVVRLDKKNDKNRKSVVRVIKKLVSGKGVTHKNRPGETFLAGHVLQLSDDLEAIQTQAAEWLPFRKGDPNIKDKGHGWALNHPLMWLIGFKKHLAGDLERAVRDHPEFQAARAATPERATAVLKQLQKRRAKTDAELDTLGNAVAIISRRFPSDEAVQEAAEEAMAKLYNPFDASGRPSKVAKRDRAAFEADF